MIYFTSVQENISNFIALGKAADPAARIGGFTDLKKAYQAYIAKYQPVALLAGELPGRALLVTDAAAAEQLSSIYREKSTLNDLAQESMIDLHSPTLAGCAENIAKALEKMQQLDPALHDIFNLTTNYYFIAASKTAGGGSSSGGLGVLWINPRKRWLEQDYLEFLVHEMTHSLLFVDERRYGHYSQYDKMFDPSTFAFSSILNKQRPLDKVLHSLFVAINVLEFRKKHFGYDATPNLHPPSTKIEESIRQTLESVLPLEKEYLQPRMRELLARARTHMQIEATA